ncbi:MAG: MBL fold metallo-hydrolase [Ignavibacteriae bacterium]|nr:MBL fold metallo-hydrolase [Ignavibacteriota bacterium]
MKIKKFIVNPFQMNCYLYYNESTGDGIIIDPAAYDKYEEDEINNFIKSKNIKLKYIVNTHGHIDHVLGNKFAKRNFNCPLLIHIDDLFLLNNSCAQGIFYNLKVDKSPEPDGFITEDLKFKLNETEISFILTPGHSPGGICIVDHLNKIVFSGDTIFRESIGRTDLPGGNTDILMDSIKNKLFEQCGNDYTLYAGHMEETTIGYEKKYNPFLR